MRAGKTAATAPAGATRGLLQIGGVADLTGLSLRTAASQWPSAAPDAPRNENAQLCWHRRLPANGD